MKNRRNLDKKSLNKSINNESLNEELLDQINGGNIRRGSNCDNIPNDKGLSLSMVYRPMYWVTDDKTGKDLASFSNTPIGLMEAVKYDKDHNTST